MDSSRSKEAPWHSGVRAARAHLLPGLALQLVSLALVLGFYHLGAVHAALEHLESFRKSTGPAFAVVSTALFGAVLPILYLRRYRWSHAALLTLFWAYKGIEVDLFYRIQAHLFGAGHDLGTLVVKMAVDQFCYSPLYAVPVTFLMYQMLESGWSAVLADLRSRRWYGRQVLPILLANWGVWIPAVAIIYALPTPLQLPLQNLVLCFYTLLLAHQTAAAEAVKRAPRSISDRRRSPGTVDLAAAADTTRSI